MEEEKKEAAHEDLSVAVDQYGDHKGADLLTDPDAVARTAETVREEAAPDHGARLRSTRLQRGFTIEELSERTGIDKELLAQAESGETLLPLGQLIKVTKVLSMRMADVISEGQELFTIVRADERRTYRRYGAAKQAKHGYVYESLAPGKKDRKMEPFIVTLHPAAADEQSVHDGQEFIYVLEGEMEAHVEDSREILHPGDAIY